MPKASAIDFGKVQYLVTRYMCVRADLPLEIQEAVLAMTERIESLLQFGCNGRKSPLVCVRVSLVVEKAVTAVKFHPDGRNVSITVGQFPPTEADIDIRNLESAIYNLLLNARQAAARSTHVPEVKVAPASLHRVRCGRIGSEYKCELARRLA
jgi:hypothetical protein